jgi:hypothetical protein
MTNADLNRLGIKPPSETDWIAIIIGLVLGIIVFFGLKPVKAEEINVEKLATAIYYAEGGAKTSHPYGILAKYKTTTPRQACVNTIRHALRDFQGGDFIAFLGSRYCPVGAKNDPTGLNKNWVKNVKALYRRQTNA